MSILIPAPSADLAQFVDEAAEEARGLLEVLPNVRIQTKSEYEELAGILKDVTSKRKFLDQERKVSVTPLNTEVKRINEWFQAPIKQLEGLERDIKGLLTDYQLRQEAERKRLEAAAQAAAAAALATEPMPGATAMTLMGQSVDAAAPKVEGLGAKVVWTFRVVDATKLPREFLQPNEAAISAWVAEHGDKNIPAGVEVAQDVRYIVRK
jgi:hypothetical protein